MSRKVGPTGGAPVPPIRGAAGGAAGSGAGAAAGSAPNSARGVIPASARGAHPRDCEYLFKLVLIGDSGVGKSCLLLRFADNSFTESFISTIGVDFRFRVIKVEEKVVKLQIWDTAGQERYHAISRAFYHNADGVIIVYDVTKRATFDHVRNWLAEINSNAKDDNCLKLLIGNKSDKSAEREVSVEEGKALAKELGMPFLETSARTADRVEAAFAKMTLELIKQRDPSVNPATGGEGAVMINENRKNPCCG